MAPTSVFSYFRNHRRTGSSPIVPQTSTFASPQPGPAPPSPARSDIGTTTAAGHADRNTLPPSPQQPLFTSASSPIPAKPPMLPPIQRVASVSERSGSTAQRPPRAPRSTTSPVLSSPRRWTFDDVPEAQDEDAEVKKDTVLGAFGMTDETTNTGDLTQSSAGTVNTPLGIENIAAGQQTQGPPKFGQSFSKTAPTNTGFTVDFDDNFRLNSLDLNDIEEETPISPSQPAPPPQPQSARRSRSPQKHWALPPLMTNSAKDRHLGRRPISDGAVSSGSSLSSVARSQSVVTLNPELTAPLPAQIQLSPVTLIKPAKQRKSILNPMSLLNRRRTSQGGDAANGGLPAHFGTVIRGTGVHDFDKPRTRRNLSTNDMDGYNAHSRGDVSPVEEYRRRADVPWSEQGEDAATVTETARKQTVPAFKENFEDDGDENGDGVRRETLANQAFLARVQDHIGTGSHSPSPPPMVLERPKDLGPPVLPATPQLPDIGSLAPAINIIEGTPNPEESASAFPEYTSQEQHAQDLQDMPPPPRPLSRDWTKESLTPRVQRVSNASDTSRWSFMPGDPSAVQERLMEQAHTDREAQQNAEEQAEELDKGEDDRNGSDGGSISDYGTEGSYYEEEPIPGADDEDEDGGIRMDVNMPSSTRVPQLRDFPAPATGHPTMMQQGLGLSIPQELPSASMYDHMQSDMPPMQPPSPSADENDDMYFNDGEIEEPSPIDDDMIDESLFDRVEKKELAMNAHLLEPNDSATAEDGEVTPMRDMLREPDKTVDVPLQDANLHAYHSALAIAAAKAEATGKFQHEAISPRQQYEDNVSEHGYGLPEQHQPPPPNELPQNNMYYYQQQDEEEQPYWQDNDYDDFDPELDLTSDDIAAANAEALAADDSGFYGREFNFYSRIAKGSNAEQMSGGYFGTPGKDSGINRSASMRDPILTPITERSEFSRAPSFMSMGSPLFGPSSFTAAFQAASKSNSPMMPNLPFRSADGQFLHPSSPAMPSPGLKELAGQMGLNHDDMTLKQLMKLRQQALGTAGLSPVMAHFSPSSPSGGLSQFGSMLPGNNQASLSPHSGAYSASPLLSSPLSGRSVNVPSPNPALPALDTHNVKIGPVPGHAKSRSLRSSLNAAISSPPPDESGSIARSSLGPADDYFSPDSPASPFSYAGSPITAGPAYGLGLDVADFGYLQHADVDDNDVAVESEDEYDSDADAEGDDEDGDEEGHGYSSSPPQAQTDSPANVQPKYRQMRPLSLHAHPVTAEDYMSPTEPNFDLQDADEMFAPLAVTKLELDMPGGLGGGRQEVASAAT